MWGCQGWTGGSQEDHRSAGRTGQGGRRWAWAAVGRVREAQEGQASVLSGGERKEGRLGIWEFLNLSPCDSFSGQASMAGRCLPALPLGRGGPCRQDVVPAKGDFMNGA